MSGCVTALYHNLYDAGRAIEDLVASGVAPGEISLVTSEARAPILEIEYDGDTRSATASGAIGVALGAIGARLTACPAGDSGILATGPLLTTLATARAGRHGFAATLRSVGISGRDAKFCEHEIRRHDALMVGVASRHHAPVVVRTILERHHATTVIEPA